MKLKKIRIHKKIMPSFMLDNSIQMSVTEKKIQDQNEENIQDFSQTNQNILKIDNYQPEKEVVKDKAKLSNQNDENSQNYCQGNVNQSKINNVESGASKEVVNDKAQFQNKNEENNQDYCQGSVNQSKMDNVESELKNYSSDEKEKKPVNELNNEITQQLKQVRLLINLLYDKSCRQRYVEQRFAYFVREEENFQALCANYSIRRGDLKNNLKAICNSYRQARGDGNCFYTAFGIQFLEILLIQYSNDQYNQFIKWITLNQLPFKINFQDFKIDDFEMESQFRDEFLFKLDKIRQLDKQERISILYQQFRAYEYIDEQIDGCFYGMATIFFRNLSNYAVEQSEMKQFIGDRQNLLIWETECNSNEIVIKALGLLLKIYIQLVFFDQQGFTLKEYFPEHENKIILLMKPGHYNIGFLEKLD